MTARKPKLRRTQTHTTTGLQRDLHRAATKVDAYPKWPDLVDKPEVPRDRKRALQWFADLVLRRIPENWQPGDAGHLAQYCVARVNVGRAMQSGDSTEATKWQSIAAKLSRQLGLNAAPTDPRLERNAAMARAAQSDQLAAAVDELGLLATPAHPAQYKN